MDVTKKFKKEEIGTLEKAIKPGKNRMPRIDEHLDGGFDRMLDGRSLRAGEKERLFDLLRSQDFESRLEEAEVKCAIAVVAFRLGILEVTEILREELEKGDNLPIANDCFRLVLEKLEAMQAYDSVPKRSRQLEILVGMYESEYQAERRAAEIVLEKADIKIGGLCSW